uniref:Uncharacterized protein n=1 Tax=Oryza brachyantha TaxID=4533 RepID=J3MQD6_ORYBR
MAAEAMVVMSSSDENQNQNQVAINMCSTPADDRSLPGVGGGATPRSPGVSKAVVPIESPEKTTGKSQPDDHDQQQERAKEVPLVKKVAAEFIGTFILIFAVLSTVVMDAQHGGAETLLGVAASAGLAVVAVVLSVVHISGSHLNPAVSIAMAAFGHLPPAHVLPYAAAQTLAASAPARRSSSRWRSPSCSCSSSPPSPPTRARQSKELVAMAIAAAIMMNALVGGPSTGPSMNPARTIGAAVATGEYSRMWVYLVAPPVGAVAGAGTYTLIKP